MTNLNCCVESCAFNKSECCCLNNIEVGGHKAEEHLQMMQWNLKCI